MNRTRIDWADRSWNPIKGLCPEACPYCYARRLYQRFGLDPKLRLDYKELVDPAGFEGPARVKFVSLEPFLGKTPDLGHVRKFDWLIIGRLTGHGRKNDPKPHALSWLVSQAKVLGIPVFLKGSLAGIWGGPLIQEYPEEGELAAVRAKVRRTPAEEGYPMGKGLFRGPGGRP